MKRNCLKLCCSFCFIFYCNSLLAFLGCAAIAISQGDEDPLMSKFSCCGHIRSYKQRCVSNKAFLLGVQSICLLYRGAICTAGN